jgi:hypothetical protein
MLNIRPFLRFPFLSNTNRPNLASVIDIVNDCSWYFIKTMVILTKVSRKCNVEDHVNRPTNSVRHCETKRNFNKVGNK